MVADSKILGIDPGVARCGWAVIRPVNGKARAEAFGVIETPKGMTFGGRLALIYSQINKLIETHQPSALALEEIYFQKNVKTAMSVGEARGVIILCAELSGLSLYEYGPKQIKQALTGYGNADKGQMQKMAKALLGLPRIPEPDDAADACAVALCHLNTNKKLEVGG